MKRPLAANTYIIIFVAVGLVLFGLISSNLIYKVRKVQRVIAEETSLYARNELHNAIQNVMRDTQRISSELTDWDEIHQQLNDPTYYVYWRELRLKKTERFPAYLVGMELYDSNGKALVALPYQNLPLFIPAQGELIRNEAGGLYLYKFSPIKSRGTSEQIAGYLGIKIDFLAALERLNRFVYIDVTSLTPHPGLEDNHSPNTIVGKLDFAVMGEPSSSRLGDVLLDSLRDYFLLFAGTLFLFYWIATTTFIQPLRRLDQYLSELRRGYRATTDSDDYNLPPVKEMVTLQRSLNEYQDELDLAQSRLDRQNIELWQLAHLDPLTGVSNRLAFDEDWGNLVEMARDKRIDVSMILFDCDFFKAINDTYGHEVGDRVIQSLAERLHSALRKGDKLYRLGGDEFVTILINSGQDEAHAVATRCADEVNKYAFSRLGIKETIKLSIGIAHAEGVDIANLSELPRQADMAMYHAKRSTREKIFHYSHDLDQDAAALVSNRIVNAVLNAIENGTGLEMHYQPVLHSAGLEIDFYEALARIRDETGLISPSDIFPIITRRNLEIEFDRAILRAVEQDIVADLIPTGIGISINISGAFLGLKDFCEHFGGLAAQTSNRRIIIELTETSFITHLQHASECLRQLREHGFTIALDDFGSGYSSIRYLANMPVDIVKFDISMVHDLNKDERTRRIIKHTAQLIRDIGYELVAEGIESEEIHQRVTSLDVTHLQGYLFGRASRPPASPQQVS